MECWRFARVYPSTREGRTASACSTISIPQVFATPDLWFQNVGKQEEEHDGVAGQSQAWSAGAWRPFKVMHIEGKNKLRLSRGNLDLYGELLLHWVTHFSLYLTFIHLFAPEC